MTFSQKKKFLFSCCFFEQSLILIKPTKRSILNSSNKNIFTSKKLKNKNNDNENNEGRDGDGFNYRVLLLNRLIRKNLRDNHPYSSCSRVFPGGNLEEQDFEDYEEFFTSRDDDGIFKTDKNSIRGEGSAQEQKKNDGHGEVDDYYDPKFQRALKICCIRETFEETGILLNQIQNFYKNDNHNHQDDFFENLKFYHDQLIEGKLKFRKVLEDLSKFNGNQKFLLDSLKFQSNWTTPNVFKKRWNTFFYTYLTQPEINSSPKNEEEDNIQNEVTDPIESFSSSNFNRSESISLDWSTPSLPISDSLKYMRKTKRVIDKIDENEYLLPPPQFHILSSLSIFKDFRSIFRTQDHPEERRNPIGRDTSEQTIERLMKIQPELIKIEDNEQGRVVTKLSSLDDPELNKKGKIDDVRFNLVLPGDRFHSSTSQPIKSGREESNRTQADSKDRELTTLTHDDDSFDQDQETVHRFEVMLPDRTENINFFRVKSFKRLGVLKALEKIGPCENECFWEDLVVVTQNKYSEKLKSVL